MSGQGLSALQLNRRGVARALFAAGCLLAAVGLPFALDWPAAGDMISGGSVLAGAGDTISVSEPVTLLAGLPLFIDSGLLQSVDATGVKRDETVERLRIDRALFRIPLERGSQPEALAQTLQPLVSHLAALNAGKIEVRNSRVEFKSAGGTTIAVTGINAEITPNRRGTYAVKGSAIFYGQPVRFDGAWSLPEGKSAQPLPRVALKVSVSSNNLDASLDGRLGLIDGLKFQGSTEMKARRLRALARWFDLDVPASTNLRNAALTSPLEWSDGRLMFGKAVVVVDGSEGVGALSLRTNSERPVIDGTLAFNVFDAKPHVEAMLHPAAAGRSTEPGKSAGPSGASAGSASTGGASLVSAFDADLRLSAAKVLLPYVESGRGAVTITSKQGRLLADVPELELEGGIASGQISFDTNAPVARLSLKGRMEKVDPGRVFTVDLKRNPLFGRANITIDGSGSGHDLAGMISNFSGKGSFALVDGGRLGLDLKALSYAVQKANHVGWAASGKGSTSLDKLDARFHVSNGALSFEALNAKSGDLEVSGQGKVDVRGRLFDLDVAIGTADKAASSRDVIVFRGPWHDPAIGLLGRPFTSAAPVVNGSTAVVPGFGAGPGPGSGQGSGAIGKP